MNSARTWWFSGWFICLALAMGLVAVAGVPMYLAVAGSLATLVVSMWLMHGFIGVFDMGHLTIPGVWYLTYVATMYIPSLLIAFMRLSPVRLNPDGSPYQIPVGPSPRWLLFAVNIALIAVPLGVRLTSRFLRFGIAEVRAYFGAEVAPAKGLGSGKVPFALVTAGSLGLSILYFRDLLSSVGAIPLVELLKLHGRGFDQLRIHSLVALNSPLRYAYAVLIEVVYPSLVAIAFGSWLHTRTIAWLVLLVLTACGGAVSAGASGARSGIAVILVVALATLYLYRKGRVGRNFVLWSLGVVLVFPVAITVALYHTDVLYALRLIGVRLFYTPAYIQYLYFQLVPGHIGYLHGRTSPIFAWLTGQGYFDLPRYVVRIPWPGAPVDATASGPFIGDFYVNFGVPGVMLGGVLAGVVMQLLQIWLVRHRKTITSLAVYAFLLYVFSTLSYRPLQVILWSGGVFFVLLIWGILAMLEATLGTRGAPAPHPEA